jgi:hypothetical protein
VVVMRREKGLVVMLALDFGILFSCGRLWRVFWAVLMVKQVHRCDLSDCVVDSEVRDVLRYLVREKMGNMGLRQQHEVFCKQ